jgi:phosphatidylserine/phosphatidylglycerophosphate/cardiolipin synthase-like enzyme
MKKVFIIFLLAWPCILCSQSSPFADIEIVESTPTGTSLNNSDIRDTHEVWLEMIGRAHQTLDIEQFYISNEPGKLLEDVLAAIYKAAARGVRVRVIVDARMYKTYPGSVDSLARYHNIEARRIDFGAAGGGIQHSKYFIVDGKEVFMGSQNFDWRALEHIHELGLRLNDIRIAGAFSNIFQLDWQIASMTSERLKSFKVAYASFGSPVRFVGQAGAVAVVLPTYSPIGWIPDSTRWDEYAIVELINSAQKTLTLQFLSYSPLERRGSAYTTIDNAIRDAGKRGIKVRMIVSDWEKGSPAVRSLKELSAIPNIEVAFTSIPEWSGGYIPFARVEHCKFIVADTEKFWLGTSNCEKSYFYATRNVGVVCTSTHLAGILARIFQKSWDSPYKELITEKGEYALREHGERK